MEIFTIDNNQDIKDHCKEYRFKIKDFKPFQFVCEYYETSSSWGHKGRILYNNYDTGISYKIRYYNRTWERYRFQSLLKHLIRQAMSYLKHNEIDYSHVLKPKGQELRDLKRLSKKEFMGKYSYFTSKEYTETKKAFIKTTEVK